MIISRISITDLIGAILALMGAFAVATQSVIVRKSTVHGSVKNLVGTVLLINVIIWSIVSLSIYYPFFDITALSFFAFILSGFFGFYLGYRLLFLSIQKIGASKTMPIIRVQVIVALILSVIFLHERLSVFHLLGILMAVIGTVMVSKEISSDEGSALLGNGSTLYDLSIPILGGFFWGLNWFFSRLGLVQGTPVAVGLAISSIGGLFGFILIEGVSTSSFWITKENKENIYWYVSIGIVCAVAFLLNFSALSISRVVVVNPIWQISPFFVLLLSYIFLPQLEKITNKIIIGSIIIVLGTITVILFM